LKRGGSNGPPHERPARAQALVSALRLARLRYGNGVGSQLDVIDAERNLLAAQRAAVADLFRALGG
jgi:multidrug efflux system outer membrane protein